MGGGRETGAEGVVAPSSSIEADVVDTVPKTMQAKARRLKERLKKRYRVDHSWRTDPRGCADCRM